MQIYSAKYSCIFMKLLQGSTDIWTHCHILTVFTGGCGHLHMECEWWPWAGVRVWVRVVWCVCVCALPCVLNMCLSAQPVCQQAPMLFLPDYHSLQWKKSVSWNQSHPETQKQYDVSQSPSVHTINNSIHLRTQTGVQPKPSYCTWAVRESRWSYETRTIHTDMKNMPLKLHNDIILIDHRMWIQTVICIFITGAQWLG